MVADLLGSAPTGPLIWGGDWNHALRGREYAGSIAGRTHLLKGTASLGLQVPTETLGHRIPDQLSVDHIAVPANWRVVDPKSIVVEADGRRLSDHDMYIVEAHVE